MFFVCIGFVNKGYSRVVMQVRDLNGPPERIRTSGLPLRRGPLYPAELRAVILISAIVGRRLTIVNEMSLDMADESH